MHDWRDHLIGIIADVIGRSLANWFLKDQMPNHSAMVQARCNHSETMCMGCVPFLDALVNYSQNGLAIPSGKQNGLIRGGVSTRYGSKHQIES